MSTQEFAPIFAPSFAHVFNVSLEKGYLPASQKKAIVYPGLKKPSLDPVDLSNYRPISNLSFVSVAHGCTVSMVVSLSQAVLSGTMVVRLMDWPRNRRVADSIPETTAVTLRKAYRESRPKCSSTYAILKYV